jgi:hypothetical protein
MIRDDLSNKLIHFTKGNKEQVIKNFKSILSQKKLIGGTGEIKGNFKCVCFTESPISKFSNILADSKSFNFPYAPFGIMVSKEWLFNKGGRPVIYQPDEDYDLLEDSLKYKHKCYNPLKEIDYTWEREWRILIDELPIDPTQTTVIIPNRKYRDDLIIKHTQSIKQLSYVFEDEPEDIPLFIKPFEWHFIALEDLGIKLDW